MTENDERSADLPLDPAAILALVHDQQRLVQRRLAAFVPWILLAWGVCWLVGFGALWLVDGARPAVALPIGVATPIFVVLMAVALVLSAVLGIRSTRGIRSAPGSNFTGAVFGITASAAFVAMYVVAFGLVANGMDRDLLGIYFPTASALIVGGFYVIAGGIWRTWSTIVLGAWIAIVGLAAPFAGYPGHYLFFSIAGGGGFLVGAAAAFAYTRGRRATR